MRLFLFNPSNLIQQTSTFLTLMNPQCFSFYIILDKQQIMQVLYYKLQVKQFISYIGYTGKIDYISYTGKIGYFVYTGKIGYKFYIGNIDYRLQNLYRLQVIQVIKVEGYIGFRLNMLQVIQVIGYIDNRLQVRGYISYIGYRLQVIYVKDFGFTGKIG